MKREARASASMIRREPPTFLLAVIVTALAWCGAAESSSLAPQPARPLPTPKPGIVNGRTTFGFPTVGALLYGDQAFKQMVCSGTMIGCNTFLTAAHCVCPTIGTQCQPGQLFEPDPSSHFVYLQNAGIIPVSSITLLSSFAFPDDDVAVVRLAEDMIGVSPSENATQPPVTGALGTIVGFGRTGGSPGANADFGIKRAGTTALEACTGGIDSQKSICWNYTGGSEANTCNGDSGGPMFIDYGSGPVVAGVTSGGESSTCLELDFSYDANVFNYEAFISFAGGSDILNSVCGSSPQLDDPRTALFMAEGRVTYGGVPYTIRVPSGTDRLVFTMNGIDDGVENFDLYVKAGGLPTTSDFDCASTFAGQFESCSFINPSAGQWSALVYPFAGYGDFQLTATAFGSKPCQSDPECDDGNPCTDDSCTGGACNYSPNTNPCDDGLFCNGSDSCSAGSCSIHAGDPCGGSSFCLEPNAICLASCPGSCGVELADRKKAKVVERFIRKRAKALINCGRRNDPACPVSCPVPDSSTLHLSAGCRALLACQVDEIAGIFYSAAYGDTWNQGSFCPTSPASKCNVARAKMGYKMMAKTLRRYRTNKLWLVGTDLARCRRRVDRPGDCGGASLCFAAHSWAGTLLQ